MITKIKIIFSFILAVSFGSCSQENYPSIQNEIQETPDFRAFFFNENNSNKLMSPVLMKIETESDLVSADRGCYTVNVRVYTTDLSSGMRWLVASDNTVVCEESAKSSVTNKTEENSTCNGILENGNYVFEDGNEEHICLYEILSKNDEAYKQYKESVNKLISNI